jgi:carbonic anhydrase
MTVTSELLRNNEAYADAFDEGHLPMPPSKEVAAMASTDARLDFYQILGLELGEGHVIRDAGGVVSEDAIRSLAISQRLFGTQEISLVHHTDCGMLTFQDHEVKDEIVADTGARPHFALEAFPGVEDDIRQSIVRLKANPLIENNDQIRGFVFDVKTGSLKEIAF